MFYVRTGVNLTGFTYVNKIGDDVETACVNVKKLKAFQLFYVYVRRSYIVSYFIFVRKAS